MSNPKNDRQHGNSNDPLLLPIAIIGASYAGLTIANVLHRNSIPYAILDSKSFPFTYVTGGNYADFKIPSYKLIIAKLELDKVIRSNHPTVENNDAPTRKDVIESLLQRVESNLIPSRRIVRIERSTSGIFYLHSIVQTRNTSKQQQQQGTTILGPFQYVVGADGVRSQVRISALPGTFLIGDARWVNDRWYDLGLRRINRGADTALLDGLELGRAIISVVVGETKSADSKGRFCAWKISRRRIDRRFAFLVVILGMVVFKFQIECQSVCYEMMYSLKDAFFCND